MSTPKQFREPGVISPRLVTKTSLPNSKQAIALLVLAWEACDKPAALEIGREEGGKLGLDDSLRDDISALSSRYVDKHLSPEEVDIAVSENPLLTAQIESLNAAFELIWHIGRVSFADKSLGIAAERTGGKRFRKSIRFSTNMDVLDALASSDPSGFYATMFSWLENAEPSGHLGTRNGIVRVLAAFAEISFYKTGKGPDNIVYTPSGVYEAAILDVDGVDLTAPGEETQGPTRILKAAIKDGLNPYLSTRQGGKCVLSDGTQTGDLAAYSQRAATAMELSRIQVEAAPQNVSEPSVSLELKVSRNLIYFGAPGTGKSYQLAKRANELFPLSNISRVTFHPDYSYAQFVGCFKPYSGMNSNGEHEVGYRYTPGPFLDVYVRAVNHPEENFLLVVEELNRANPAGVFGDIFQLLDRDTDGSSTYAINTSEDMAEFLADNLIGVSEEERNLKASRISIPSNMYIWATMNSADQGVFPMDTAFKRRWDFKYIGIDDGEDEIADIMVSIGTPSHLVRWNDLRKALNSILLKGKVNEDKLLGPFFIAPAVFEEDRFEEVFCSKVLLYLFEDAAKTKKERIFDKGSSVTYSMICDDFSIRGEGAFKDMQSLAINIEKTMAEE